MKRSKNYNLVYFMLIGVVLFLSGCNTPASEKIIGKWSGATEKNKTIAKEMAEKDESNPLFDEEMLYQMYSAISIEFTQDKFKIAMGEMVATENYEVLTETKSDLTIKTEDGEQYIFTIKEDNEITFEDKNGKMYMVKVL